MAINWTTKHSRNVPYDVSVTFGVFHSKTNGCIRFTFRNNSDRVITDTEYIVFGYEDNRIYFKKADKKIGYHVSFKTHSMTRVASIGIAEDDIENLEKFIGDHNLKLDEKLNLYYIESEES